MMIDLYSPVAHRELPVNVSYKDPMFRQFCPEVLGEVGRRFDREIWMELVTRDFIQWSLARGAVLQMGFYMSNAVQHFYYMKLP